MLKRVLKQQAHSTELHRVRIAHAGVLETAANKMEKEAMVIDDRKKRPKTTRPMKLHYE